MLGLGSRDVFQLLIRNYMSPQSICRLAQTSKQMRYWCKLFVDWNVFLPAALHGRGNAPLQSYMLALRRMMHCVTCTFDILKFCADNNDVKDIIFNGVTVEHRDFEVKIGRKRFLNRGPFADALVVINSGRTSGCALVVVHFEWMRTFLWSIILDDVRFKNPFL